MPSQSDFRLSIAVVLTTLNARFMLKCFNSFWDYWVCTSVVERFWWWHLWRRCLCVSKWCLLLYRALSEAVTELSCCMVDIWLLYFYDSSCKRTQPAVLCICQAAHLRTNISSHSCKHTWNKAVALETALLCIRRNVNSFLIQMIVWFTWLRFVVVLMVIHTVCLVCG